MRTFGLFLVLVLLSPNIIAQESFSVSGKIVDASGLIMPGVNVQEKNTNNGTVSDSEGNYNLIVSSSNAILEISFIGFETIETQINGKSIVNFKLKDVSKKLNEIVVTALGVNKNKDALGYSLTEVNGNELSQIKSTNAFVSLQGKVAGVNISQNATGSAGSTRVIIRGTSSLTGDNQPLYVLDGIPIGNITHGSAGQWGGSDGGDGISSINPDEIESIKVLKGGSAAALYGSRAAGGVILITTKTGRPGKGIGVDFSSSYTFDALYSLRDFQTKYGQGQSGKRPKTVTASKELDFYSWGEKYDGVNTPIWTGEEKPYSYVGGENASKFYQTGFTAINTLGISSGNEDFNFRFAVTHLKNNSIVPNSNLNRTTFSLNTSISLAKKLTNVTSIKYITEFAKNRPRITASPGNLNYTLMFLPGNIDIYSFKDYQDENGYEKLFAYYDNRIGNPYFIINRFIINDEKNRIIASNTLTYDIFNWLYAKARVGIDSYGIDRILVQPYGVGYYRGGVVEDTTISYTQLDSDFIIGTQFKKRDMTFSALVGANYNNVKNGNLYLQGWDIVDKDIINIFNTKDIRVKTKTITEKALGSLYVAFDFGYKDYAFLNLTGRQDWFSTLSYPGKTSPNNYFYPSANVSLLVSKMTELPSIITYLKLRGGVSQVAGGADQPYQLSLNYQAEEQHLGQTVGSISSSTLPNANLIPFTKDEFEIGFDSKFLKDKIGLDVAYYVNTANNDIVNIRTSVFSAYNNAIANLGKVENTGIEVLLTAEAIKYKNITWNVGLNGAYNIGIVKATDAQNSRIDLDTPSYGGISVSHIVNERYGTLYGTSFKRDANGNIVYEFNSRGIPLPIVGERKILGNGVAPLTIGLTNSFNYKGINLYFLTEGKFGGQIYSATNAVAYANGLHKDTLVGRESDLFIYYQGKDGELLKTLIAPENIEFYYWRLASIAEHFIYDSDYVRLKQVSISYTLPKSILQKTFIGEVTLSIIGANLFYLYNAVPNVDPESSYNNGNHQGIENFGVPTTRQYGFNLNVKF